MSLVPYLILGWLATAGGDACPQGFRVEIYVSYGSGTDLLLSIDGDEVLLPHSSGGGERDDVPLPAGGPVLCMPAGTSAASPRLFWFGWTRERAVATVIDQPGFRVSHARRIPQPLYLRVSDSWSFDAALRGIS